MLLLGLPDEKGKRYRAVEVGAGGMKPLCPRCGGELMHNSPDVSEYECCFHGRFHLVHTGGGHCHLEKEKEK
jgi:hypothetical protein